MKRPSALRKVSSLSRMLYWAAVGSNGLTDHSLADRSQLPVAVWRKMSCQSGGGGDGGAGGKEGGGDGEGAGEGGGDALGSQTLL